MNEILDWKINLDYSSIIKGVKDISAGFKTVQKDSKTTQMSLAGIDKEFKNIQSQSKTAAGSLSEVFSGFDLSNIVGITQEAVDAVDQFPDKWKEATKSVGGTIELVEYLAGLAGFENLGFLTGLGEMVTGIENLSSIAAAIPGIWNQITTSVGGGIDIFKLWTAEMGPVKGTIDLIATALGSTTLIIIGVIAAVAAIAGAIMYLWETNETFRNALIETWNGIMETVNLVWETTLKPIWESFTSMLTNVWELGIMPLWEGWTEFVGSIVLIMTDLWNNVLKPIVDWFFVTFGPIIALVFEGLFATVSFVMAAIGQTIGSVFSTVSLIVDNVIVVFKGIIDFLLGAFSGDWERAWEGVKAILSGVVNSFFGIFENVWNLIVGLFNSGGTIFSGIVDGIGNVFKNIANQVIDGVNTYVSPVFVFIGDALNKTRNFEILGHKPFYNAWGPNIVSANPIPRLAKGGIAYGRTLGEIAEYPNARSNPEVIAPLDKLKNLIGDTNRSSEQIVLLQEQNRLLRKLNDKDIDTYLDGERVNKRLDRQKKREARMKGYAIA